MKKIIFFLIVYIFPFLLSAQINPPEFGKSRVQNENFQWKTLSFRNFNVYYYGANQDLAEFTGKIAEDHLFQATELLGIVPHNKLHFIVYSSVPDYEQSNIGIYDPEYISSGNGSFLKSRIEVCFNGTRKDFEKDVKISLLNTLLNTYLLGGNFKEALQSTYFLTLPDWFVPGASHYIVEGWSQEMDNYIRSVSLAGKLKDPSNFKGTAARLVGQSIWNYFFIKYGPHEFKNLLSFLRQTKSYKAAIEVHTGLSYDEFLHNWETYYNEEAHDLNYDYKVPDKSNSFFCTSKIISSVATSTEGITAIGVSSRNQFEVHLAENGKTRRVHKKGRKVENRKFNHKIPLLKWVDKSQLAMIYQIRAKYYFEIFDTDKKKSIIRRVIPQLECVNQFDINTKTKTLVISGATHSQCDLFSFGYESGRMTQLTNNAIDETCPAFISGTPYLAYIYGTSPDSKQGNSILILNYPDFKNADTIKPGISQISELKGSVNSLYFISSETGVRNIYKYNLSEKSLSQITNSILDISVFDISGDTNIIQSYIDRSKFNVSNGILNEGKELNPKKSQRALYLTKHAEEDILEETDTLESHLKREINIYNYLFEFEKSPGKFRNFERLLYVGPKKYQNRLNIENVGTSLVNDPIRGFGLFMEGRFSDLLENHKIDIGAFGITDLRIKTAFMEYQYLKHRIDFRLRLERKTYDISEISEWLDKYAYNFISPGISFPFNESARITFSPFIISTTYIPIAYNGSNGKLLPFFNRFYTGQSSSFIYDNSVQTDLNVRKGLRSNLSYSNYITSQESGNFSRLNLDIRNYLPLIRTITLVNRLAGGGYFGQSPKNFLLGGVDNWFGKELLVSNSLNDPLYTAVPGIDKTDLFFTQFVTPMRGFGYNRQFGQRYFLLNAEIRIPFAGNLYPKEMSSSVFKNFQGILFTDFGSAWTGKNPFSRNNSVNKQVFNQNNSKFSAVVYNYKNPFLLGYGFGLRTLLLGYYVKAEQAWGVSNGIRQNRFYLSIGYDF